MIEDVARPPRSILIILMGALGDVVRGLSLVSPLKRAWPEVRVSWLVEPKCEQIVRMHSSIDEVITFNRKQGIRAIPALRRQLRQSQFDLCLDLQRHFKSGLFSWLSDAPRRIGFHRRDAKEFNWIFNTEAIPECGEDIPKIRHYFKFLEQLGVEVSEPVDFGLGHLRLREISPELSNRVGNEPVILVLGSSWDSKDWPAAGYSGLIQNLITAGVGSIVLVGDKGQSALGKELSEKLPHPKVINLVGATNLKELVALIGSAKILVGPDSGPAHLAGAMGKPYVSLFGPTSPRRVAPYRSEHLVIQGKIACAPCYRRRCPGLNKICMRMITVESVMEKLRPYL